MHALLLPLAFVFGSIPFAFLIGRARGIDIRTIGSGNVGATNLARACGLWFGAIALAADASKGALPVLASRYFFSEIPWLPPLVGCASIAGHCFSPFLGWRGGKGVATALGVFAVLDPLLTLALAALWGLALAVLRNVGVASSAAAAAALTTGVVRSTTEPEFSQFARERDFVDLLLIAIGALILIRHRKNILDFVLGRERGEMRA